jgi:hypothetical protein
MAGRGLDEDRGDPAARKERTDILVETSNDLFATQGLWETFVDTQNFIRELFIVQCNPMRYGIGLGIGLDIGKKYGIKRCCSWVWPFVDLEDDIGAALVEIFEA